MGLPDRIVYWGEDTTDPAPWKSAAADGSRMDLSVEDSALRFDYDLVGPTSWVIARRELEADLPDHYVVVLKLRGTGPANQLQLKFVDPCGHNVWWWRKPGFVFSGDPQVVVLRKASLEFAWGPKSGGMPDRIGAVEFALAAPPGGAGTVWLEELRIEARDASAAVPSIRTATASSCQDGHDAASVLESDGCWIPETGDRNPWIELDLGSVCEWGGVVVDFAGDAKACRLLASNDRECWTPLAEDSGGHGARRWLRTADGDGRYARVELAAGTVPAVERISVVPLEQAVSPARHLASVARKERRGLFPRHMLNEQAYWAIVGADGDERKGLLSEHGALEVDAESFSIEPFLWIDGALVTWAEVETSLDLADGHLPIPSVTWVGGDLRLRVTGIAAGEPGRSTLIGRYEVENRAASPRRIRLLLAIRPFQVNPAWQSLNLVGGVSPLTSIERIDTGVRLNGARTMHAVSPADGFGASPSEVGPRSLLSGEPGKNDRIDDPIGFAECAFAYDLELDAGAKQCIAVAVPLFDGSPAPPTFPSRTEAANWADERLSDCIAYWRERLAGVPIELPPCAEAFSNSLRASIAWVLVNREGPRIQPGPRCYRRSWIRDGTLTGTALAEMGFADIARDFLRWYAPYQREDGQVPCAVDRHGIDPVDEHDSHGQLIWGVVEVFRLTGDRDFLVELWPHVLRAVDAIAALRARRTTDEYRGKSCFGLMPESISHEGYSSRPVHAYWDDFFAVRGLADAAWAATQLGDSNAARIAALRDAMRSDLHASIVKAIDEHGIDFLPGSVELGDFDPTSTAIALDPGWEGSRLPQAALARTFERYWEEFESRRRGEKFNDAYTAYEVRNAPALVLLGQKQRAVELLQWLIDDQRPPQWCQWPEVTTRDPRAPRFIGDLPHGWIGSSFVRTVRRMVAYERADDGALVLGAGIPEAWVREAPGVRVNDLATHAGPLSYTICADGEDRVRLTFAGDLRVPAAGMVVESPLERPVVRVVIDGRPQTATHPNRHVLHSLPGEVVLEYAAFAG